LCDRYYHITFYFQAEDGIRYRNVTGVQTCALPISDDDHPHRFAGHVRGGLWLALVGHVRLGRDLVECGGGLGDQLRQWVEHLQLAAGRDRGDLVKLQLFWPSPTAARTSCSVKLDFGVRNTIIMAFSVTRVATTARVSQARWQPLARTRTRREVIYSRG